VSAEEVVKCEEQYEKGKAVDSILTQVAKRRGVSPESLYEKIAWPLHRAYGHTYEAFKISIQDPERIFGDLDIDEETLAELKHNIARRLTPKPVKVRADIEVKCFAYSGIEAIRKALRAGEACSTEEVPIKVRLVAPPLYVMSTTSTDKTAAIEVMEKAVEAIGNTIAEEKGDITIKMAPKVVSETEDAELKALMEQFEQANMDVAGDDDDSEDDE
jgi:translation initiation factor 2 subunit 1